jgi:hypothetical protein
MGEAQQRERKQGLAAISEAMTLADEERLATAAEAAEAVLCSCG